LNQDIRINYSKLYPSAQLAVSIGSRKIEKRGYPRESTG
jgi:hypothetical protein